MNINNFLSKPHKSLFRVLCLCFLSLTFFISCETEEPTPTKEQLLAGNDSKTWMIERIAAFGVAEEPEDCNADDELIFYTNKEALYKDNELKCHPDAPDMVEGSWSFSEDEESLTIIAGPAAGKGIIEELTDSRLKVIFEETGVPVTITFRPK